MAHKAKAQIQLGADYNGSQAIRQAIADLKKLDDATKKSAVKNIKLQLQQAKAQRAASTATAKADKNLQRQARKAYKEQLAWEKKVRTQRGSSRASGRYQSDGFGNSRRKTGVSEYTMTQGGSWLGTGTRGMRGRGKYMRAQVKAERDYTTQMKAFVAEKKKQAKQRKQVEQMQRWGVTPGRWTGVGASVRGMHANAGAGKRHYSSFAGLLHTGSTVKNAQGPRSIVTPKENLFTQTMSKIQNNNLFSKMAGLSDTLNTTFQPLFSLSSKFLSLAGIVGIFTTTLSVAVNALSQFAQMVAGGAQAYVSAVTTSFSLRDEVAGDINRAISMTNGNYTKSYDLVHRGYQHAMESRMNSADYMNTFSRFNMAYSGWKNEEEAFTFTDTVAKALAAGGAETGEVASVMLQLSQAFNKGNLNGDELRSISENSYILRDAIQKQVLNKLKVMADTGEITAEQYEKYSSMGLTDLGANGLIVAKDIVDAVLGKTSVLDSLFEKTAWTTGQMKENLWTSFKDNFIQSGANESFTTVYKSLLASMPALTEAANAIFTTLGEDAIPDLASRIQNTATYISEHKEGIASGIDTVIEVLGWCFDATEAFIQGIVDMFQHPFQTGLELLGMPGQFLSEKTGTFLGRFFGNDNSEGNGAFDGISSFFNTHYQSDANATLGDQGLGAVEAAATNATAAVQTTGETATEIAATATENISSTADEASTWGLHLAENFAQGLLSGIDVVSAAALSLAEAGAGPLHQTVADYGPLAHTDEWGGHLVENIATGITDNADMLAKASNYLANKESTGIKDSMAENFRNSLMNNWYRNTNNHTFTSNISFGDINNGMNPKQVINEIENFLEEAMASAVVS